MTFFALILALNLGFTETKFTSVVDEYIVEKDDTLNTISIRLYGVTRYGALMYLWNRDKMSSMTDLKEGMVLKLRRKRVFSREAGHTVLLHYYKETFGIAGPPSQMNASVGTIQEVPAPQALAPDAIPLPPPAAATAAAPPSTQEIAKAIDAEKKSVIDNDPTAESVLKGEEFLKKNDLVQAKAQFADARNDDPTNPTPRILEISTLLQMGNQAEAKVRARELVSQDKEYCALPVIKNLTEPGDCL